MSLIRKADILGKAFKNIMVRTKSELTTVCYLEKDDCYLMLHRVKKEKDINKDKWIGIGGHIEDGESPDECIVRETMEETGLTLNSYALRGIITFVVTIQNHRLR